MGKNKKELGHIGYKISAVLLAIVAWLAVANISDYQTTRQISNIPVTQINGDVLDELDQVYDVVSGDTVDIIVKGRRSVVGTLDKDDFTAIADLSTMSITNKCKITPKSHDKFFNIMHNFPLYHSFINILLVSFPKFFHINKV